MWNRPFPSDLKLINPSLSYLTNPMGAAIFLTLASFAAVAAFALTYMAK